MSIIRPIHASDEGKMQYFHEKVSHDDVYHRYYTMLPLETRRSHLRLAPRCNIDYRHHMAFVAENESGEIVSIARVIRVNEENEFEIAFFTRTDYKGQRLASLLMETSIEWAQRERVPVLIAMTERGNQHMRSVFKGAEFIESPDPEDHSMVLLKRIISTP
jgi:GNAT superfamily N-acetyltransferase